MNKLERLEYIKKKLDGTAKEIVTDAIIPFSKRDVREEMELMDSFREHQLDKKTLKKQLTSDEG